jgi:branched-chain amino acid transport system substrate-binding protein
VYGTEKLIDNLESMRKLDMGLGTTLSFGRAEHQASPKIWGTALDENGQSNLNKHPCHRLNAQAFA